MMHKSSSIRPVSIDDAPALASIYNYYIKHTTATFEVAEITGSEMCRRISLIAANHPFYVHESDGRVDGYCYAHPWKERAAFASTWETTVYIAPESTGKGLGLLLMCHLIDACRRRAACHALVACITGDNTASIALHEKLGFVQTSHFREVGNKFGRWLDIVDLELLLSEGQNTTSTACANP